MLLICAQAPGTDVEPFLVPVHDQSGVVNIRCPDTVGAAFRVAHVVTSLARFPADFAHCHSFLLPRCFDKPDLYCKITRR